LIKITFKISKNNNKSDYTGQPSRTPFQGLAGTQGGRIKREGFNMKEGGTRVGSREKKPRPNVERILQN